MKNKIIYLFLLIFSISVLSSAKKLNGNCDKVSSCSQLIKQCNESKQTDKQEAELPSLGLFLINI